MTKKQKIGFAVTILLSIIGAFLIHPLASLAILIVGFNILAEQNPQ